MSLFHNNGSCCGNTEGTTEKKSKCTGCVCELLNSLANGNGNPCRMGGRQLVRLVLKGADEPLNVNDTEDFGTVFTLISFDPKSCCVVLTYEQEREYTNGPPVLTRTIVLDCRCICAVICIEPGTTPPVAPVA